VRTKYEYYIVENDVSLLLKKRPCLDLHYKHSSIQHYSLKFYSIQSLDVSRSADEQRKFIKAIEKYQEKVYL